MSLAFEAQTPPVWEHMNAGFSSSEKSPVRIFAVSTVAVPTTAGVEAAALVVAEEEELVLEDGTADGSTKDVTGEGVTSERQRCIRIRACLPRCWRSGS